MLIDSHCHLTYPGLFENVPDVLSRAAAAGVMRMVTIGTHIADHAKALSVAKAYPQVFAALGIHPHHAGETEEGYEAFLENAIKANPKLAEMKLVKLSRLSVTPVAKAEWDEIVAMSK